MAECVGARLWRNFLPSRRGQSGVNFLTFKLTFSRVTYIGNSCLIMFWDSNIFMFKELFISEMRQTYRKVKTI